jgi:hypothetical protein
MLKSGVVDSTDLINPLKEILVTKLGSQN